MVRAALSNETFSGGAFHRAIAILPGQGTVTALVEDDLHHMRVTLGHDGTFITAIEGEMIRAPWSTCPGAPAVLAATFTGARLAEAGTVGAKKQNCTHLFDIAVLAAAHALDAAPTRYDLCVEDPEDGVRHMTIARNGTHEMAWVERDRRFVEPPAIAGMGYKDMGAWIASLDPAREEMARLLRGSAVISHGRQIPMEKQSNAMRIPPNCHTFQPGQRERARRISGIHDFTEAMDRPLDGLG
ncbi:DUF2889 domain-containing protein [Novosphingobium sp. YJ-S2-02]|uniref:DUF2889 domain-containing protein n=1 Tax=Novosphingobium aureum TaxID=2792964 RepID=A0A931HFT0_9SPHN|nr:DUF2889 domain-containing protein [Novosphingobium aureum]MBH0114618.1 DUF2889 domain-containing protein [Novosphingobium aureum]